MIAINEAYFINTDNHIPNLEGCIKNEAFTLFMKRKAKEALCLVLGVCLVNELNEHFEEDGVTLKDTAPKHIKNLVNGLMYDKKGSCGCSSSCSCSSIGHCDKVNWDGLIQKDYRESLIADYVYFQWMLRPSAVCCDVEKTMKHEILKQQKRIDAWNRFVSKVQECGGCSVSLYRFLKDHRQDFSEHEGSCLTYKNYMSI